MREKLEGYRRTLFLGIIMIALGTTFTTTLKDSVGSIGIVFVAVGGFFFIVGIRKKQKEEEQKNK